MRSHTDSCSSNTEKRRCTKPSMLSSPLFEASTWACKLLQEGTWWFMQRHGCFMLVSKQVEELMFSTSMFNWIRSCCVTKIYRTNEYLDEMNVKFFAPHGLYALIMCYKPSESFLDASDTVNESVARRVDGDGSHLSRQSGTTRSELELPDAAPLIFPGLDAIPDDKKPNVAKRAGAFMSDYYDRRAQARFVCSSIILEKDNILS